VEVGDALLTNDEEIVKSILNANNDETESEQADEESKEIVFKVPSI